MNENYIYFSHLSLCKGSLQWFSEVTQTKTSETGLEETQQT